MKKYKQMWTIQDYVTIHLLLDSDEQYLHIQYSKMIHELDIHSLAVTILFSSGFQMTIHIRTDLLIVEIRDKKHYNIPKSEDENIRSQTNRRVNPILHITRET